MSFWYIIQRHPLAVPSATIRHSICNDLKSGKKPLTNVTMPEIKVLL